MVSVFNAPGHERLALPDADAAPLPRRDAVVSARDELRAGADVVDPAARKDYERRIIDLQHELEQAEADHDLGRAERAQEELDALVEHLSAALGLGGRSRTAAGTAERARSAVTHRLRATVRRLDRLHPELGRHLSTAVRTGSYCSYQPERPTVWTTR